MYNKQRVLVFPSKHSVRDCQGLPAASRPDKHTRPGGGTADTGRGGGGVRHLASAGLLPRRDQDQNADGAGRRLPRRVGLLSEDREVRGV